VEQLVSIFVIFLCISLALNISFKTNLGSPASVFAWFATLNIIVYLYIVLRKTDIASLADLRSFTALPWSVELRSAFMSTLVIHALLVISAWVAIRKMQLENHPMYLKTQFNTWLKFASNTFIIIPLYSFSFFLEVWHFIEIDKSVLIYHINYVPFPGQPEYWGISTLFGHIAHLFIARLGVILVALASYLWVNKQKSLAAAGFVLCLYPFVLVFSQNSRWAPLYVLTSVLVWYYIRSDWKKWYLWLWGMVSALVYVKVMIGRQIFVQGIAGIDDVLRVMLSNIGWSWFRALIFNIFQGATGFANAVLIHPTYPAIYKLLSFAPTISAVDGFRQVRTLYEVRITPFNPINSYGEAFYFGIFYFIVLLGIVIVWLRTATRMYLRGGAIGVVFQGVSYWITFYLSQYPIRNTVRIIYIMLFLSILYNWRAKRSKRKRSD